MHATTVAIDLAKDVFELAYADAGHRIVERKRLSRRAFAHALDNYSPLRVVMLGRIARRCSRRGFMQGIQLHFQCSDIRGHTFLEQRPLRRIHTFGACGEQPV